MSTQMPDLRKLNHAITLADTGSYVRACERLHISQSALTRSIQVLEASLGIALFDRTTRGVRPTRDGADILARARTLLLQARTLDREVAQLKAADIGSVSFGLGPAMPFLFLADLTMDLHRQHPGLSVKVVIESPAALLNLVREEQIECLVAETGQLGVDESPLFQLQPLARLHVGFFVRHGHPLSGAGAISLDKLASFPLATTHFQEPDSLHRARPFHSPSITCNDLPTLRRLVLEGDAVMLGLAELFRTELATGAVRELQVEGVADMRPCIVGLVSLAGRTPSRGAREVTTWLARRFMGGPATAGDGDACSPTALAPAHR